jgi:hypothetical protein
MLEEAALGQSQRKDIIMRRGLERKVAEGYVRGGDLERKAAEGYVRGELEGMVAEGYITGDEKKVPSHRSRDSVKHNHIIRT